MNKSDIVNSICDEYGESQKEVRIYLEWILETIQDGLINDGEVNLPPLGRFLVIEEPISNTSNGKWKNPKTGEIHDFSKRKVMKFRPNRNFKKVLNGGS